MEELLRQLGGLPSEEVDRLIGEYRSLVFHHAVYRHNKALREQTVQSATPVSSCRNL